MQRTNVTLGLAARALPFVLAACSGSGGGGMRAGDTSGMAADGGDAVPAALICGDGADALQIDGALAGLTTPFDFGGSNTFGGIFGGGGGSLALAILVPMPGGPALEVDFGVGSAVPVSGQTFTVVAGSTPEIFIDAYTSGSSKFPGCRLTSGSTFTFNSVEGDLPSGDVQLLNVSWAGFCQPAGDAGQPTPMAGCVNFVGQ